MSSLFLRHVCKRRNDLCYLVQKYNDGYLEPLALLGGDWHTSRGTSSEKMPNSLSSHCSPKIVAKGERRFSEERHFESSVVENKLHKLEDLCSMRINPWRAEPGRSGLLGGLYRLEGAKRNKSFKEEWLKIVCKQVVRG